MKVGKIYGSPPQRRVISDIPHLSPLIFCVLNMMLDKSFGSFVIIYLRIFGDIYKIRRNSVKNIVTNTV